MNVSTIAGGTCKKVELLSKCFFLSWAAFDSH
jgi:hypothetical protein